MHDFQVGDVVFHAQFGPGLVLGLAGEYGVSVDFPEQEVMTCDARVLSFKAWDAPVWQRPPETGWHVVRVDEGAWPECVRYDPTVYEDQLETEKGFIPVDSVEFLFYLGTELDLETTEEEVDEPIDYNGAAE